MFDRINQYYKEYLLMNNGMNNLSLISTTTNNNNNNNNLINKDLLIQHKILHFNSFLLCLSFGWL